MIHKYDDKDFIELLSQYGIEQVGVMQLPPYEDLIDENNCEIISYSNLDVYIPDLELEIKINQPLITLVILKLIFLVFC